MTDKKQQDSVGNESSQYQIRPNAGKTFPVAHVREIINEVLLQVLDGKVYASSDASEWSRQIVNDINKRIKDLETPRYKHLVQVMLAEQAGAGSRYIARCIWDASCDSKVSEQYKSETIICIVTVFGIYRY